MTAQKIQKELKKHVDPLQTKILARFFKTGKGEYGEGDIFMGINVPNQRIVAKTNKEAPLKEIEKLLTSRIHEHRLTALLILTYKYPKETEEKKEKIIKLYLANTKFVNNWDLVDLSAPKLLGQHSLNHSEYKKIIHKLSKSKNLWKKRIAMLSTYTFIQNKDFKDAIKIAETLLHDNHDLIHKAVGWMLREIGKMNQKTETQFLDKHHKTMPRTMLRYAIEKFPNKKRKYYMK